MESEKCFNTNKHVKCFFCTETNGCSVEYRMGSRPAYQMLKDLAALGLESGGVTLLPFSLHVSSLKKLEHRVLISGQRRIQHY